MQSGIDSSRLRIANEVQYTAQNPREIDQQVVDNEENTPDFAQAVHSELARDGETAAPNLSASPAKNGTPKPVVASSQALSFDDVLDTINPLNHIPIVSTIYQHAIGHQPSSASNIAGGVLMGGPLGFIVSLANEIYESATGSKFADQVYAALTGEHTTQVASKEPEPLGTLDAPEEMASIEPSSGDTTRAATVPEVVVERSTDTKSNAVLDLYGGSSSASSAYQKAQFRPYLRASSHNQVL